MSALALTGNVRTMSAGGADTAEAVAWRDGRLTVVGARAAAEAAVDGGAVASFGERTILPGFIDAHAHVEIAARTRTTMVDCRAPQCATVDDVLQALRDGMDLSERTGWLVGQGNLFFDQKLQDKRLPLREELDKVSRTVPIAVRCGGHRTVMNTAAFEQAGIDRFQDGGTGLMGAAVVERDSSGNPTGVVAEIDNALPIPEMDGAELSAAIDDAVRELFTRYGVTSIGEITETRLGIESMDALAASERLGARISAYLWTPGTMTFDEALEWQRHLTLTAAEDRYCVAGIKMFSDGGYSARNAATRKPYLRRYALRPGSRGRVNLDRRQIAAAVRRSREAGLQLAVHANGERAQDAVCEGVLLAGGPSDAAPATRIEHAGNLLTEPSVIELWERAGIIPMPQAVFLYNFGDFLPTYLGDHGAHGRFPFRMLVDRGWDLACSSDVHLGAEDEQTNPLFSVWCTTKRQGFLGDLIEPEQAVTIDESLVMHTRHGATALHVGDQRGTLEAGKVADVIVLDRDLDGVGVDDLRSVNVDYVFVGGRLVHERPGAVPPEGASLGPAASSPARAV